MSDPFSTAAGAIQIADFALRSAQQIYAFIGDLKSAGEDVQQLWAVLGETEDLMQYIVSYMREWQDQSRLNQDHRHLPPSLETAVRWFSDDMKQLRNCLTPTPEISFASRVKFVFRERDVKKITGRLQERKGSMNTVLSTIGRRNDLVLQHGVKTITSSVDVVRQQQTATLTTVHDAVSQFDQLRQAMESQHSTVVSRLQALEAPLASPPTTSRPSLSLATDDVPDDPHLVSRIVRAEIKRALEPFADTIAGRLDSVVESTAREVLRKRHEMADEEGTDEKTFSPAATVLGEVELDTDGHPPDPCLSSSFAMRQRPADIQLSRTYHKHSSIFGDVGVCVSKFRRRTSHVTRSPVAYFQIRVDFHPARWITSYGISASYSTAPDVFGYYEICPRILPFRVLSYRSRVADLIYNDDVSEFKRMINRGEINWFDQFASENCRTFLEFALLLKSPGICRFLMCDLLVEVSYLFRNISGLELVASFYIPGIHWRPHQMRDMAEIYPLLRDHLCDKYWDTMRIVSLDHARLSDPGVKASGFFELAKVAERGGEALSAFPWHDMSVSRGLPMSSSLSRERWFLDLFLARGGDPNSRATKSQVLPLQAALDITTCCFPKKWPAIEGVMIKRGPEFIGTGPMPHVYVGPNPRYTLGIILKYAQVLAEKSGAMPLLLKRLTRHVLGGDSSATVSLIRNESIVRLAKTLNIVPRSLEAHFCKEGYEEGPEDTSLESSEQDGGDPFLLLVPLMESGADVHAIVTDWDGKTQCSMADYARGLELEDVWNSALERCGYNPGAVKAESDRRLAHASRLNEGNASGIDASSLELPEVSGLRRRRTGGRNQMP